MAVEFGVQRLLYDVIPERQKGDYLTGKCRHNAVVLPILSKGHIPPSLPGCDRWLCPEDLQRQHTWKKKRGSAHM